MNKTDLNKVIVTAFYEIFDEQAYDVEKPELVAETVLLDTGLDSLGFALLVLKLEESVGYDPFTISDSPNYPVTLAEFVDFYHETKP